MTDGPEALPASCSQGTGSPIRHNLLPTLPSKGGTQRCHGVTSQLPAGAVPPHELWEATSEPSKPPSHAKPHPHPARAEQKCNLQHIPHWPRAWTSPQPCSSGSWDEAPPEALLVPELLYRSLPKSLQLLPPCQAAGQAKFYRQLPESGESPHGVPWGSPPHNWGPSGAPQQSQKQPLGLRLGRREDKCPPSQGRVPGRGGKHMGGRD